MTRSQIVPGVGSSGVGIAFLDGAQVTKVERWILRESVSNFTKAALPSAIFCSKDRSIYPAINGGEPELINRSQPRISSGAVSGRSFSAEWTALSAYARFGMALPGEGRAFFAFPGRDAGRWRSVCARVSRSRVSTCLIKWRYTRLAAQCQA